jgi:hypothetical protein
MGHENSSIIMGHENHLYSSYKIVWNAPKEGKKLIIKIYSPSKVFGMLHKSEKIILLRKHHPPGMLPETQGKSTQVT